MIFGLANLEFNEEYVNGVFNVCSEHKLSSLNIFSYDNSGF